jgi:hypothetical protein
MAVVMHEWLQVTGYRSQVTGHGLQVTGYRSQVTGHRLQVTGYRSQVTVHRLQVTGYRSQVAGHRLQVTGCRSQVAGHRLQVTGCRSHVSRSQAASRVLLALQASRWKRWWLLPRCAVAKQWSMRGPAHLPSPAPSFLQLPATGGCCHCRAVPWQGSTTVTHSPSRCARIDFTTGMRFWTGQLVADKCTTALVILEAPAVFDGPPLALCTHIPASPLHLPCL